MHHLRAELTPEQLQMLVSVVQIVAALYTLYSTEGAQIARWGYAAYGLSVLPYALM